MSRPVDPSKVIDKLLQKLAEKEYQIALLEAALDAVEAETAEKGDE